MPHGDLLNDRTASARMQSLVPIRAVGRTRAGYKTRREQRTTPSVRRSPSVNPTPAIGALGLIGDTRTAALVDTRARIVWLCLPHFDGEPVFGALVAGDDGGSFVLGPAGDAEIVTRRYRNGSTILETTWHVGSAHLAMTEGMVAEVEGSLFPTFCLVRRLEARGDTVDCMIQFDPRFGIERRPPQVRATPAALVCVDHGIALGFTADRDLDVAPGQRRGLRARARPAAHRRGDRRPSRPPHAPRARRCVARADRGRRALAALVGRHRLRRSVRRGRRAQPHHPAAAHVLAVGGTGSGTDDVAARTARRLAQLGLPLRMAPRRQHRHRRLPRRRPRRASPRLSLLAAARQPPRPPPPARAADLARPARATRTGSQ